MDKRDQPLYGVKGLPVKVKSDVKNESFSHVILRSCFGIYAVVQSQKAVTANCLLFEVAMRYGVADALLRRSAWQITIETHNCVITTWMEDVGDRVTALCVWHKLFLLRCLEAD